MRTHANSSDAENTDQWRGSTDQVSIPVAQLRLLAYKMRQMRHELDETQSLLLQVAAAAGEDLTLAVAESAASGHADVALGDRAGHGKTGDASTSSASKFFGSLVKSGGASTGTRETKPSHDLDVSKQSGIDADAARSKRSGEGRRPEPEARPPRASTDGDDAALNPSSDERGTSGSGDSRAAQDFDSRDPSGTGNQEQQQPPIQPGAQKNQHETDLRTGDGQNVRDSGQARREPAEALPAASQSGTDRGDAGVEHHTENGSGAEDGASQTSPVRPSWAATTNRPAAGGSPEPVASWHDSDQEARRRARPAKDSRAPQASEQPTSGRRPLPRWGGSTTGASSDTRRDRPASERNYRPNPHGGASPERIANFFPDSDVRREMNKTRLRAGRSGQGKSNRTTSVFDIPTAGSSRHPSSGSSQGTRGLEPPTRGAAPAADTDRNLSHLPPPQSTGPRNQTRESRGSSAPSGGAQSKEQHFTPEVPIGECQIGAVDESKLYAWQREAVEAWTQANQRGIVEAVTGAGKSRMAMAAIGRALRAKRQTLVIVPTLQLVQQWIEGLSEQFPGLHIGAVTGTDYGSFRSHMVLVTTMQSNYQRDVCKDLQGEGLLVGDEVHRLGADRFADGLHREMSWRLGLTATLERNDDGVDEFIRPYFGDVVYELGYERALADDVIAPFRVALLRVPLNREESEQYDAATTKVQAARDRLRQFGLDGLAAGEFQKRVAEIVRGSGSSMRDAAVQWQHAVNVRRSILADSRSKSGALDRLAPIVDQANGTLIFTQKVDTANRAVNILADNGVQAAPIVSDQSPDERSVVMNDFRSGDVDAVASPRVLDEGVDVPDADLGIVMAASRSRRQMVQRLGRVIRKKAGGGHGKLVVMYAPGTSEDPTCYDEDSGYLPLITDHAQGVLDGNLDAMGEIESFLSQPELPASKPEQA